LSVIPDLVVRVVPVDLVLAEREEVVLLAREGVDEDDLACEVVFLVTNLPVEERGWADDPEFEVRGM